MASELPELLLHDVTAWRDWLHEHHDQPTGVRLVLAKKSVTEPTSISYEEALQEALCYGWIDGQVQRRDDSTYLQRFTPRRPRSPWSRTNTERAHQLIHEGRMQPAGLAQIEAAKADGRWEQAYAGQANIEVPDDLIAALDAHPRARRLFDSLDSRNRYAILYRLTTAKKPETRSRRIATYVDMLAKGETIHPRRASSRRSGGSGGSNTSKGTQVS